MSLLRDIQNAATSQDNRVSDLLRKCKILAARLQSDELNLWVERELNGYKESHEPPDYRTTTDFLIKGNFFHLLGDTAGNESVSLSSFPQPLQQRFRQLELKDGISVYEDMLSDHGKDMYQFPIQPSVSKQLKAPMYIDGLYRGGMSLGGLYSEDWHCSEAWRSVPRGVFVNIFHTVRNKILEFVLDIEKENPQAGEADVNTTPVPAPIVNQTFNSHFHGSSGNVAVGSQNFEQNATVNQQWQAASQSLNLTRLAVELPQLREALAREAKEPEQYLSLSAVRSAELEVEKKDGPKVLEQLAKAGQWALDVAKEIGSTVAAEAIKKSLNLSGP